MTIQLKRNDTKDVIGYTMTYANGTPVVLTGATVRYVMGKGNTLITNASATVVDAATGKVEYTLTDADTLLAGTFQAEFEVTFADGKVKTFPNNGYISVTIQSNINKDKSKYVEDAIALRVSDIEVFKTDVNAKVAQAQTDAAKVNTFEPRINNIVAQAGNDNTEIVDARLRKDGTVAPTLGGHVRELATQLAQNTTQLLKSYGLKCDNTDTVAQLQNALNDTATKYKRIVFPANSSFYLDTTLHIPANFTIDFNGADITVLNDIDVDAIQLDGDNITLKNLKLSEIGYNYFSDSSGIGIKPNINVSNIVLENVTTKGFLQGIAIWPSDANTASNIKIINCTTHYASNYGTCIANANNVNVYNLNACYNGADGFKIIKKCFNVEIIGGYFSYNVHPVTTRADGIDLYAGGGYLLVDGAVCEYNGGGGIHLLSGEATDPAYVGYYGSLEKNIIITNCICNNNTERGIDVINKTTVSATAPHPSKVIIDSCIMEANDVGLLITARHVNVSNCISAFNNREGISIQSSRYVTVANCQVIKNSQLGASLYNGILILSSNYITIDKGVINGADSDTLQAGDESALTVYHSSGIYIDGAQNSDNILIEYPVIVNYTSGRQVLITNTGSNPSKKIILHLWDIGNDNLVDYRGFYGSTLYKGGRWYKKLNDLAGTTWVVNLVEKYGNTQITSVAGTTTYYINHNLGLGIAVADFNAILTTPCDGKRIAYVTASSTQIAVTLDAAPTAGTVFNVQWYAKA